MRLSERPTLLIGAALACPAGFDGVPAPGAVLASVEGGRLRILASGEVGEVERHPAARDARRVDLPGHAILPGLVNAHSHLDLTHAGARPFDRAGGFRGWLEMVLHVRVREADAVRASVRDGVARSMLGGVVAVGDIAGVERMEPTEELRSSDLIGDSFHEFFGVGERQATTAARVGATLEAHAGEAAGVRLGLSPHAPYTVGLRLYDHAQREAERRNVPVATHLAEGAEEREFVATGRGLFRELLERLGVWDDTALDDVGGGRSPIAHLESALLRRPMLLAHVNDCPDADIERLALARASVAYCARCSDYFLRHEEFGAHRYLEMLAAGVNVCLGTDSVINLPPEEAERLSTLDDARFLFARDGADPRLLLRMATTHGARALGLEEGLFTLAPGEAAGLVAVDVEGCAGRTAAERVMRSGAPARLLAVGKPGRARFVGMALR
ncbi:MAG: amidohydrolase family protein [Phycisphaerales bacterium]|nr:amidohydrolase family protein [Phycisphaerales bacterium]